MLPSMHAVMSAHDVENSDTDVVFPDDSSQAQLRVPATLRREKGATGKIFLIHHTILPPIEAGCNRSFLHLQAWVIYRGLHYNVLD